MFICSVKASSIRTGILVAVIVTAAVIASFFAIPAIEAASAVGAEGYTYTDANTEEGRIRFLSQFGWQTVGAPVETVEFTLPEEFDRVMLGYNEIQREMGLDLSRYRKKKVTRYTYELTGYEGYEGKVYANLIVYRDRVIGGDISSADPNGFVHGFERPSVS